MLAVLTAWSGVCTGPHVPKLIKIVASLTGATLAFVTATRIVTSAPGTDVVTYHNDNARTGQNLSETILTPASVNSSTFGNRGFFPLDGKVDAQPLYVSALSMPGLGTHSVLYAVTEHDSVYALDAVTGSVLWRTSTLGAGETTSDTRGCSQVTPEIGITSTPVIDRSRGPNGTIYVVAMSKTGSTYFQRLHALDLATGAEAVRRPEDHPGIVSGEWGRQFRRLRRVRPEAIRGAGRADDVERPDHHGVDVPLRHRSIYRVDHGLRRQHAGAVQRPQHHP